MEQVAPSRTPIPGVLKPMENRIGVRERPKGPRTMLSPEMKRTKTVVTVSRPDAVVYPESVPIPSKRVIKALYKASLEEGCEGANEKGSGDKKEYNDQQHLTPAGILSFEKVLLPAIGLEEEKALKKVQSKLQRDAPEYTFLMENCRRLVRESIRCAMHEVQSSRSVRQQRQQERKQQQVAETKRVREIQQHAQKEEQERLAKELARKRETSQAEKKRYLARESPRNQELWKEIVFLTSSVTQLEREERMWIQIEQDMIRLEGKQNNLGKEEHPNGILLKAPKNLLQVETEEKVNDVILTSTRIQKGLEMILKLLTESETLRKELYGKYKKDHIFRGYQSVKKPKSLIRFLSQSQDDHL